MKILASVKEPSATSEYSCEFCNRSFQKETTMIKHICESKRRWQDKDLPANRIGFQTWVEFYKKNSNSKKPKTYVDFSKSAYYIAFVKFGNYCINIKCVNVARYSEYLLKNKISIDSWCTDTNYTKFLIQYLREEDALDAVARSIETSMEHAPNEDILAKDYLRYGNRNRICHLITNGKISPWMLYHSHSGVSLLESLDEAQQRLILEYINPEKWAVKFKRNPEIVKEVYELLKQAGY